jgi:hypothetical protein
VQDRRTERSRIRVGPPWRGRRDVDPRAVTAMEDQVAIKATLDTMSAFVHQAMMMPA